MQAGQAEGLNVAFESYSPIRVEARMTDMWLEDPLLAFDPGDPQGSLQQLLEQVVDPDGFGPMRNAVAYELQRVVQQGPEGGVGFRP